MLAAVHYDRGYDIDGLLCEAAAFLSAEGFKLGGLIQRTTGDRGGSCANSVHVVDLRTGRGFDIWQDRGPSARGCRLDETGLTEAEHVIDQAIQDRVDLLMINRFGRAESLGRGLRRYVEQAFAEGIPVLTAVKPPYAPAWQAFAPGLAVELTCDAAAISDWARSMRRLTV
jgi:nucleoside-triphosphatase THEP1